MFFFQSIIDALGNALESSVNMMEKYFDKVTYTLSDSEDEEDEDHRRWDLLIMVFDRLVFCVL